jgi:hypothetical protein
MDNILLYDKSNIDSLIIPNNEDAKYAYNYLAPMIKDGVKKYIKNIDTELKILKIDDILLPVNFNNIEYTNSYTSSLYAHYVSYTKEELYELKNPVLEFILNTILNILGYFYKQSNIDKVVYVNNWFLSTNLYLELSKEQYQRITKFLKEKYPNYAIIFRSLNDNLLNKEITYLKDLGYKMLGSRQVYIFDYNKRAKLKGKDKNKLFKDIKLLKNSKYKVLDINNSYIKQALNLYNQLYLDKYSKFNPQFSEEYIKLCYENKLLNFKLLSKNNKINAVLGYYKRNNIMTTPIFGYDTALPKEEGLYRMLSAQLVLDSEQNGCTINMSSGASKFKIYRGAIPSIEYSALYYSHLPSYRRLGYKLLSFVINKIAIPMIKSQKL